MPSINIDTIPCGIWSFDGKGIIQGVNGTLCGWLGYDPENLTGQPVELLLPVPSRIFYQTHLFPLLNLQKQVTEIFITLQKKNKEIIPVLLSGQTQTDGKLAVYTCACIMFQNRKFYEDELVEARNRAHDALQNNTILNELNQKLRAQSRLLDQQLTQSRNRNAELTQLSRAVTHQLQEPLRKLAIFSQISTQPDEPPLFEMAPAKILEATVQLRSVVTSLQQYIWLQEVPVRYASITWEPLFKKVQGELLKRFEPGTFRVSFTDIPSISGDQELLAALLGYVLDNSIQFRKEGEPADISIEGTQVAQNSFQSLVETYEYVKYLKLEIKDSGVGFDPQYSHQVFELFQKLDNSKRNGAGLAMAALIVRKHGGIISAHSEMGQGTTITILLPMQPASAEGDAR